MRGWLHRQEPGPLGCAGHREKGNCDNGRTIRLGELERRVLGGIRCRLLDPEIVSIFLREYRDERKRLPTEGAARRGQLQDRLGRVESETGNIGGSIFPGLASAIPGINGRLAKLEA